MFKVADTMDEGTVTDAVPDLKDIEVKIGRKTPEGLLRWMREEAPSLRGDAKLATAHDPSKDTGKKSLDEKIRKLKIEMVRVCVSVCVMVVVQAVGGVADPPLYTDNRVMLH